LDLKLRAGSEGRVSLDTLMRILWQRHGLTGVGVEEGAIFDLVAELAEQAAPGAGRPLARWLRSMVSGTEDLPLVRLLRGFGVDLKLVPVSSAASLGVKLASGAGEVKLAQVHDDGAAQRAGLSAGDVLIALDGLRVSSGELDTMLMRRTPGEKVEIHAFRRDELMRFEVELDPPARHQARLTLRETADATALRLRKGWLNGG